MARRAVDTNILVYAHLASFPEHLSAKRYLQDFLSLPDSVLFVTPIILHELVHVITDSRRFDEPVKIPEAIALTRLYLNRTNVQCLEIDAAAVELAFDLIDQHQLGRKRIADTLLVATLVHHSVEELVTHNRSDFEVFAEIRTVDPIATT